MFYRFVASRLLKEDPKPDIRYVLKRLEDLFKACQFFPNRLRIGVESVLRALDDPYLDHWRLVGHIGEHQHPDDGVSVAEIAARYHSLQKAPAEYQKAMALVIQLVINTFMPLMTPTASMGKDGILILRGYTFEELLRGSPDFVERKKRGEIKGVRTLDFIAEVSHAQRMIERAQAIIPPIVLTDANRAEEQARFFTYKFEGRFSLPALEGIDQDIRFAWQNPDRPITLAEAEIIQRYFEKKREASGMPQGMSKPMRARELFLIQRFAAEFRKLRCFLDDFRIDPRALGDQVLFKYTYNETVVRRISKFYRYPQTFVQYQQSIEPALRAFMKGRRDGRIAAYEKFRVLVMGARTLEEPYTYALILAQLIHQTLRHEKTKPNLSDWIQIEAVDDYQNLFAPFDDMTVEGLYPKFLSEEVPSATMEFALSQGLIQPAGDHILLMPALRGVVRRHDLRLLDAAASSHAIFTGNYHTVSCVRVFEYLHSDADTPAQIDTANQVMRLLDGGTLLTNDGIYVSDGVMSRMTYSAIGDIEAMAREAGSTKPRVRVKPLDPTLFIPAAEAEAVVDTVVYLRNTKGTNTQSNIEQFAAAVASFNKLTKELLAATQARRPFPPEKMAETKRLFAEMQRLESEAKKSGVIPPFYDLMMDMMSKALGIPRRKHRQ